MAGAQSGFRPCKGKLPRLWAETSSFGIAYKDGTDGPEMVVIPAGSYLMGSPDDEEERDDSEGLQHEVTIAKPFALGRFVVTFEEYGQFCAATGRGNLGDDGRGRGRRPVVTEVWEDVKAYAEWLTKQTGTGYRLPTEAEWEYAARAGTTGPFSFEGPITTDKVNYDGGCTYNGSPEG